MTIIGLLSTPEYDPRFQLTNQVTAIVRAMTGSAIQQNGANSATAFRYQLTVENVPWNSIAVDSTNYTAYAVVSSESNSPIQSLVGSAVPDEQPARTAPQIRVAGFSGPSSSNTYTIGPGRQTYRSLISSHLLVTNNYEFWFFQPQTYYEQHLLLKTAFPKNKLLEERDRPGRGGARLAPHFFADSFPWILLRIGRAQREGRPECVWRDAKHGARDARAPRNCRALTILEMLVSTAMLAFIVLGLTAMFIQTQKVFKTGIKQTTVTDAGRTIIDMIASDLSQMSDPHFTNVVLSSILRVQIICCQTRQPCTGL